FYSTLYFSHHHPLHASSPTRRSSDLMPRRVKVVVRMQRCVSPAVGGGIVVRVGTIKDDGAVANNGQPIDKTVVPASELCIKGQKDRKSTRLNSSHGSISYAVFCLKKK